MVLTLVIPITSPAPAMVVDFDYDVALMSAFAALGFALVFAIGRADKHFAILSPNFRLVLVTLTRLLDRFFSRPRDPALERPLPLERLPRLRFWRSLFRLLGGSAAPAPGGTRGAPPALLVEELQRASCWRYIA